jgi:phosphomannomutase/phosphoglucomutase
MAKTGKRLSELIEEQPKYFLEKGTVDCSEDKKERVLEELLKHSKDKNTNTIDGVKIWFEDESAILVRPSGTEPVYRMYAEAKEREKALKLIDEYTITLKKILANI